MTAKIMHPSAMFYQNGTPNPKCRARTLRVGRLELCSAWFVGQMPSRVYILWPGQVFPKCAAFTFRVYRMMVGFRWYDE